MNNEHIITLIESKAWTEMTDSDLATAGAHTTVCESCNQAWQAARISALLLKERAAETFAPTPFFETRVLAALRERQSEQWTWARMWRATGALASSMVATVAAIAVLTFVMPASPGDSVPSDFANNSYSAEEVILNQNTVADNQTDQLSDAQVLTTLYGSDEEK